MSVRGRNIRKTKPESLLRSPRYRTRFVGPHIQPRRCAGVLSHRRLAPIKEAKPEGGRRCGRRLICNLRSAHTDCGTVSMIPPLRRLTKPVHGGAVAPLRDLVR